MRKLQIAISRWHNIWGYCHHSSYYRPRWRTAKWLGLAAACTCTFPDPHMGACGLANNRSVKPPKPIWLVAGGIKEVTWQLVCHFKSRFTPTPRTGESSRIWAFLTVSTEAPPSCATTMTRASKWAYYRRTIWLDLERVMGMDWEDIVTAQRRREKASASEAGSIVSVAAFGTGKPSLVAIATSGLTNLHRNIDSLLYIYAYYAYNFGRKCK